MGATRRSLRMLVVAGSLLSSNHGDDSERNASGNQAVLDGGRAGLIRDDARYPIADDRGPQGRWAM